MKGIGCHLVDVHSEVNYKTLSESWATSSVKNFEHNSTLRQKRKRDRAVKECEKKKTKVIE